MGKEGASLPQAPVKDPTAQGLPVPDSPGSAFEGVFMKLLPLTLMTAPGGGHGYLFALKKVFVFCFFH